MAYFSHTRYHGVLSQNEVTVDWLSIGTWFRTTSALGTRRQTHGLGHPLWFGYPMFVTWEDSGWNMVMKTMTYVMAMTYSWALG